MKFPAFALGAALSALPALALETDRQYGAASFQFLKLPLSPRIVALGGAGVALSDGAGELDLNPAAPASDSARLVIGKGFPFSEFRAGSSHITWSIPYHGYRILLNARYLGFDDLEGWDGLDQSTSKYGAHTLKLQGGLAGHWRKLFWGATLNYAENNIAEANYGSGMANAGFRYAVLPGLFAGVSLVNADFWGSGAKDPDREDPFPPTALQAGLGYGRELGKGFSASIAADARTRNDEKLTFPAGAEVAWRNMIFARVGYPFAEPEPALNGGLGLRWALFQFQYAYQGHATLGPGHYWALEIAY